MIDQSVLLPYGLDTTNCDCGTRQSLNIQILRDSITRLTGKFEYSKRFVPGRKILAV